MSVYDLNFREAMQASVRMRMNTKHTAEPPEAFRKVISIVGGRLSYLGKAAKAKDMMEQAEHLLTVEKAWLQSQIGLIEDHDDDVMDEVSSNNAESLYIISDMFPDSKNGVHAHGCCCASL